MAKMKTANVFGVKEVITMEKDPKNQKKIHICNICFLVFFHPLGFSINILLWH